MAVSSPSFVLVLFLSVCGSLAATFTFTNKCEYTVWPGILANAGTPTLETTGFELPGETYRTLQAPAGWSGRFWGRTGCTFDGSRSDSCSTGDCGSGRVECLGSGAAIPVTLAEFSLGTAGLDFYDVSLVDGFNIPIMVEPTGGRGACASTGCAEDLNRRCPPELKSDGGEGCRSACSAFGSPEYCCSGAYGSPATCKPSAYSSLFKTACPSSYSYAYDDASSTFTCAGADYTITFCPSVPSRKSTTKSLSTPVVLGGSETGSDPGSGLESDPGSGLESDPGSGTGSAVTADGSWLAGLAMGGSNSIANPLWGPVLSASILFSLVL